MSESKVLRAVKRPVSWFYEYMLNAGVRSEEVQLRQAYKKYAISRIDTVSIS